MVREGGRGLWGVEGGGPRRPVAMGVWESGDRGSRSHLAELVHGSGEHGLPVGEHVLGLRALEQQAHLDNVLVSCLNDWADDAHLLHDVFLLGQGLRGREDFRP